MSNRPTAPHTAPHTATYPTGYPTGYPAYRPVSYPAGWQAAPAGYVREGDPRLAQADATPTATFPTNRSARTPVRYHAPQTDRQSGAPEQAPALPDPAEQPLQDMGRPGLLARPSMRWHPSLMQLAIGAALVAALLGACNVAAINAHRTARAYCHALAASDWDRAQRECRSAGASAPAPEQAGTPYPSTTPSPSTAPASPRSRTLTRVTTPSPTPSPSSSWVTSDTHAPFWPADPSASPLDLPRCTTAPDTPVPCLAHASADGRHTVVLEEDGSMTGLIRR